MNITVIDNLHTVYDECSDKGVYVARNGCVITDKPLTFHIPMKAANGELVVAHGIPGVPMEVGKLILGTIDNYDFDDITGYQYISKAKGLSPDNLKIVSAQESALDLRRDFFLNRKGMQKIYMQKGQVTGDADSIHTVTDYAEFSQEDLMEALMAGGGYANINGTTFSVNRYFQAQKPYLTREGIIRIGQVGCYSRDTGERIVGANTLSAIWEAMFDKELSDRAVYDIISTRGSWIDDHVCLKFSILGDLHTVEPMRTTPPIF